MHAQRGCFANINLSISAVLVVVAIVLALKALYRCDPEFLLPWQRDVTLLLSVNILV